MITIAIKYNITAYLVTLTRSCTICAAITLNTVIARTQSPVARHTAVAGLPSKIFDTLALSISLITFLIK